MPYESELNINSLHLHTLLGQSQPEEEELVVDDAEGEVEKEVHLVVYNDDVNTFDWVIQCFIEILGHSFEQAEQLAIIIHFKGKATVKTGSFDELHPLKDALIDRGLSAVIES